MKGQVNNTGYDNAPHLKLVEKSHRVFIIVGLGLVATAAMVAFRSRETSVT